MDPIVSVVVPNYNHAAYLPKRIESIINQTYPIDEIIILDDSSTDNSKAIIDAYAQIDKRIVKIYNDKNSGSTFKQWNKGVKAAKGNYIWLAESDDYAELNFLETLMLKLVAYPKVGIAYTQSWNIDENDTITSSWKNHTSPLDVNKWNHSFVEDGREMIRNFMTYRNVIPNASAVVFKKQLFLEVGCANESLKLNSDWILWIKMLLSSDIIYVAEHLNYFRTHTSNVRKTTTTTGLAIEEMSKIVAYAVSVVPLPRLSIKKIVLNFIDLWLEHNVEHTISVKRNMRIFYIIYTLDKSLLLLIIKRLRHRKKLAKKLSLKVLRFLRMKQLVLQII